MNGCSVQYNKSTFLGSVILYRFYNTVILSVLQYILLLCRYYYVDYNLSHFFQTFLDRFAEYSKYRDARVYEVRVYTIVIVASFLWTSDFAFTTIL